MKRTPRLLALIFVAMLVLLCLPLTGCSYCQHKLEEVKKVPATCVETGLKTAYKCTKCGKLFAYTDATGLYEIKEQEVMPLTGHTVSGEFSGKLKEGISSATSLADYEVYGKCAICEQDFKINPGNLIAFAPSDYRGGTHFDIDNGTRAATSFTFTSGTTAGTKVTIEPLRDSGDNENANVEVPFEANVMRYLVMTVHNSSNIPVAIKYGAERNGERCLTEVTVPAEGYATFTVNIKFSGGDPRSWHELYIMQNLDRNVTLSFTGYYYASNILRALTLKQAGIQEFMVGTVFDPTGIQVQADFGENVKRILKPDEYTINLTGKVLTEDDDEVIITYKNKTVKYPITVRRFYRKVTLVGATFADGTSTKELEQGTRLPDNIVINGGKTLDHWVDVYGVEYRDGYTVTDSDVTLCAMFAGAARSENYALGKTCTASDAGFNPSSFGLNKLTDGIKTGYNAWGSDPHSSLDREVWVQIDLGGIYGINEIALYPRVADGYFFPEDYYIEVSTDGVNYTKVFELKGDKRSSTQFKGERSCFFNEMSARYVRITATKLTHGGNASEIYCEYGEIEVYRNA